MRCKLILYSFCLTLATLGGNKHSYSQIDFSEHLKQLYPVMFKDETLTQQISIRNSVIYLYPVDNKGNVITDPEFALDWEEVETFLKQVGMRDMSKARELYLNKGVGKFDPIDMVAIVTGGLPIEWKEPIPPLAGYKIALDPGHFAHNFTIAKWERKYIQLRASDMGTKEDIRIYEAKLTGLTGMILKDMLEELGAEVLITRSTETSATGKNFNEWYAEDFQTDLVKDLEAGLIDSSIYEYCKKNSKTKYKILRKYFIRHEFICRANKINAFQPDLTLIMHYNVDENNNPDKYGYHKPHGKNFSMVFVGGAYAKNELSLPIDRMFFIRQALSYDIEKSVMFSSVVENHIVKEMGVPAYKMEFPLSYIEKYSIPTDVNSYPGVFHRNLYLTRTIYGTIAFAEPLLQDNKKEALKLSTYDCEWNGVKVPCRLIEMATAYKNAILEYKELADQKN